MTRAATAATLVTFLVALGASTLGPSAARAEEVPTADELVAKSRAALGTDRKPESERELWSIRMGGLDGTFESVRRGLDSTGTTILGPFRTARGTDHGERWHQNENGETILDRPEPSQIERTITQTVTRVRQPVDAWVVTTTFTSGHVTRTFYDARTYYVVRTERVAAGRTMHAEFDDFRTDARGRTRAWHYSGGDDRAQNDYDYRLTRADDDPAITDAELSIPHDRRTLVEFPSGLDAVRLPARIEGDRIYVRLQIAGRGLDFLLDTGAASLTIDAGVARELRLGAFGRSEQTAAGTFETRRVVVPEIAVGTLAMHDVVMRTVPFSERESRDVRVVGLLGFDFIDALGLKIDYAAGTVDAYRPGTLGSPEGAVPLEIRLNSGAPVTRVTLGEVPADDFILDTGAAFPYVVFQRFARAHADAFAQAAGGRILLGSGVGGTMSYRSVTTKRLTLGATTFEDVQGAEALAPSALGFDTEDGLIGADLLKAFTVYFDYAADRAYLGPRVRAGATPKARR